MDATTRLRVRLSGTIARNEYTDHPDAVLAELREIAGDRLDVLAKEAGIWVGFHENNQYTTVLVSALKTLPGLDEWIVLGRERRAMRGHTNPM